MINNKDIKKIAKMLTDDPDIFNETFTGTSGIAIGAGGNIPAPPGISAPSTKPKKKRKKRRKKVMNDEPITKPHPPKINTLVDPNTTRSRVGPNGQPIRNADQVIVGSKEN